MEQTKEITGEQLVNEFHAADECLRMIKNSSGDDATMVGIIGDCLRKYHAALSSLPSDSEIEKAAEEYANTFKGDNETIPRHATDDFTAGVLWLRSQLNTGK